MRSILLSLTAAIAVTLASAEQFQSAAEHSTLNALHGTRVRRALDVPRDPKLYYGPLIYLRDNSGKFKDSRLDSGGWWMTPVHANLLPNGKILIMGWSRLAFQDCNMEAGEGRKHGLSFVLDPATLPSAQGAMYNIEPLSEVPKQFDRDVMYCSGHTHLPDGRILILGGATYQELGVKDREQEYGLDYVRVFDPTNNTVTRLEEVMPIGTAWYPSAARLPGGKVLVTGGFFRCCGDQYLNTGLAIFDINKFTRGERGYWELLARHGEEGTARQIGPGLRDYTHFFVLPKPVDGKGVAAIGAWGKITLIETNDVNGRQWSDVYNGDRPHPDGAYPTGWDSSSLLSPTGELMIMGGSDGYNTLQRIDLWNPETKQWRSVHTGIKRRNPDTVILPDGTILIINGDRPDNAPWYDFKKDGDECDYRCPQIFDPFTNSIRTLPKWEEWDLDRRGYHSWAIVMADGKVLTGGGVWDHGGIACEHPSMRIFTPPYLLNLKNSRPEISELSATTFRPRMSVRLSIKGELRQERAVALLAPGSFTHAFDQHQRYVALSYHKVPDQNGVFEVSLPQDQVIIAGGYYLYVINIDGTPSVGKYVQVEEN